MNTFRNFVDSSIEIWNDAAPAARVGIGLLLVICLAAIIGVGYWSAQPTYVTLVSDIDHQKMDRIIDALDKANIEYDLSGAGGNLRVSKSDFSKARMLARGAGAEAADSSPFGMAGALGSPDDRYREYMQKKQRELEKTLQALHMIDQADVHLNVPKKGPFVRKQSLATASVLLTLAPGAFLNEQQAQSIAKTVANAVPDLEPQSVQITDRNGVNYTVADKGMQFIGSQIEYIAEEERRRARKAEEQLTQFLGHGNASVQVTLDLTFKNGTTKKTDFDGDGKVPVEEELNTEETTNARPASNGPAGVDANLVNASRSSKDVESKTEKINTKFNVPTTETTETHTTPIKNFMTVSVLVNQDAAALKQEDGSLIPNVQNRLKELITAAVGYTEETDKITVELFSFPANELVEDTFVPPYDWSKWSEIARNASLAIGAIVAFVIGFLVLRKVSPSPSTSAPVVLDDDRSETVQQLTSLFRDNPELFTQIVQSWSGVNDSEDNQADKRAA